MGKFSLMHYFAAVVSGVCLLGTQVTAATTTTTAAPTTTTTTTAAPTTYIMRYEFEFTVTAGTPNKDDVAAAVNPVIVALGNGASLLPMESLVSIDEKTTFYAPMKIQFPASYAISSAKANLKAAKFASDLQAALVTGGVTGAKITSAKLAAPGDKLSPADLPGTTTTTTTTATTTSTYAMKYKFSFSTTASEVTGDQIKDAAQTAVVSLKIDDAKVKSVDGPTKVASEDDGDVSQYTVVLDIQFPTAYKPNLATASLKPESFASDLQSQMAEQGVTAAKIASAEVKSPGQAYIAVDVPDQPDSKAKAKDCGKDPVIAGLLTLFLGGFGAGRFYYGYIGLGVAWLVWTLLAHFGNIVASVMVRTQSKVVMVIGIVMTLLFVLSEIGLLIWWIHDLVVIFNKSLKPFGAANDCVF